VTICMAYDSLVGYENEESVVAECGR